MVATIGIMMPAYIFTRMISSLARGGERAEPVIVRILAGLTALVTIVCGIDLLIRGLSASSTITGQPGF